MAGLPKPSKKVANTTFLGGVCLMKVRFALVTVLIMVLVGAVSVVGLADTGTITASIDPVLTVAFTGSLPLGIISGQYDGTDKGKYLEVTMNSNENYTVQVTCSGNLEQAANYEGYYQIETEYAIWKSSNWNDNWGQQPGPGEEPTYTGWLSHLPGGANAFYENDVVYPPDDCWFDAQAAHFHANGGKVDDATAVFRQWFNNIDFVPSKYFDSDTEWHWKRYNYGSNSIVRIYPYLDLFEDYGTAAGAYSGTVTIIVSLADSWATTPPGSF